MKARTLALQLEKPSVLKNFKRILLKKRSISRKYQQILEFILNGKTTYFMFTGQRETKMILKMTFLVKKIDSNVIDFLIYFDLDYQNIYNYRISGLFKNLMKHNFAVL